MGGVLQNAIQNSGGGGGGGGGGLTSFNGRTAPAVVPTTGDYNAAQVSYTYVLGSKYLSSTTTNVSSAIGQFDSAVGCDFRNGFMNGDFSFDQQNGGASFPIGDGYATPVWGPDGWGFYSQGGNFPTGQRVAGQITETALEIVGAAGVTQAGFYQNIRAKDAINVVANSKTCISIYFYCTDPTITSVNWEVLKANSVNDFGTIAAPNTTSLASGAVTVSSTLTRFTIKLSSLGRSNCVNGIQVKFTVGALESGVLHVEMAQIERNSQPTPFEIVSPQFNKNRCYARYFQSWGEGAFVNSGNAFGGVVVSVSSTNAIGSAPFPVEMDYAGAVTLLDETGATGTISQPGFSDGIVATANHIGTTGFTQVTSGSAMSVGAAARGYYKVDARD